jgi:endonuclease-3
VWDGPRDALEVLVLTVLSQNTTDLNALRGYTRLCEAYPRPGVTDAIKNAAMIPRMADGSVDPVAIRLSQVAEAFFAPDWPAVMAAPVKDLENVIRPAGLPNSKAPAIQRVLHWLQESTGGFRLETAIAGLSTEAAIAKLSSLKGIGLKTAAVTLIEATGADVCPVDTHVHRIVGLLGVVETTGDRERTHRMLQPLIPSGKGFALHHNLLTLGRTVCHARGPKCGECPVQKLCAAGRLA